MQKARTMSVGIIVVALVLMLISFVTGFIEQRLFVESVSGTVTDKYIKRYGEKDYFHVAFDLDSGNSEVFQNRDSLWWLKFRSADTQQEFIIGQHYNMTVVGWRIPFLSKFRNIVKYEPAGQ